MRAAPAHAPRRAAGSAVWWAYENAGSASLAAPPPRRTPAQPPCPPARHSGRGATGSSKHRRRATPVLVRIGGVERRRRRAFPCTVLFEPQCRMGPHVPGADPLNTSRRPARRGPKRVPVRGGRRGQGARTPRGSLGRRPCRATQMRRGGASRASPHAPAGGEQRYCAAASRIGRSGYWAMKPPSATISAPVT
jgi:hypothetical protein